MRLTLLFLIAPLFIFSQSTYTQWAQPLNNTNYENHAAVLNFDSGNNGNWTARHLFNESDINNDSTKINSVFEVKDCLYNPNLENNNNITYIGLFGNNHYYLNSDSKAWMEAQSYSIQNGGNLVVIDDANENQFISNYVISNLNTGQYWIGYKFSSQSNQWEWVDIAQTVNSFTEVTTCESYEWNGQTYTESGTYSYDGSNNSNDYSLFIDNVSGSYVELDNFNLDNTNFSISIDFKSSNGSNYRALYRNSDYNNGNGNGFYLRFQNNGELHFDLNNLGAAAMYPAGSNIVFLNSGGNYADNQWHNATIVHENGICYMYVDGIIVDQQTLAVPISSSYNTNPLFLGVDSYQGNLDNFSFWNSALSYQDIQNYINCPPTGLESNLLGFWNFEEGEGETVIDLSGNGNDATINGATHSYDVPEQSCQLTTVNGCDSITVLNLTINQADTSFTDITSCESYEWNGQTYTESGTYEYSDLESYNNYSMSFDGVDDYVTVNNNLGSVSEMSISVWVNIGNQSIGPKDIIGNWNGGNASASYLLSYEGAVQEMSFISLGTSISFPLLSSDFNTWMNVSVTYNGSLISIYKNGQLMNSVNASGIIPQGSSTITFGTEENLNFCQSHWNNCSFEGYIDDLQIWNYALSHQEIQKYMNCPPTENEFGLVGYWNFEEGEGYTVYDLSGNGNDGAVIGATFDTNVPIQSCQLTTVNSCDSVAVLNLTINQPDTSFTEITACESYEWNGQTYTESGTYSYSELNNNEFSMSFDGINNSVVIPNEILNEFSQLTFSSWFFATSGQTGISNIIQFDTPGYGGDFFVRYHNDDNDFEVHLLTNNFQFPQIPTLNAWNNVTVTYNGNLITYYLNGNIIGTDIVTGVFPIATSNSNCFLGNWQTNEGFKGNLDDTQIWNVALSQQKIQQYMSCPPTGNEEGLVGYWNFEEGSGNTVLDKSGNGNDGTINGASFDTNVPSQSCQLTTINGCDSTAVLNLTINQGDTSYTSITACDSYTWNDSTYTQSGTYSYNGSSSNNSLSFDGVDDWIEAPTLDLTGQIFTIEGWIKIPTVTHVDQTNIIDNYVFGQGGSDRWGIYIGGTGTGNGFIEGQIIAPTFGIQNSPRIDDNNWHHFAFVRDQNGLVKGYIDGQFFDQGNCPINYNLNAGFSTKINGGFHCGGGAQCRFMNFNLSEIQVSLTDKYNSNFIPECTFNTETSSLLHYRLNNSSSNIVNDLSFFGNNGIIYGNPSHLNDFSNCQLTSFNGCDSTAILNLTINNSNTGVDTQVHCDTYTWIDGVTYTSSNNSATWTLTNAAGCDSLVTLDLTILDSNTGVDTQVHCDTYTWIDGNTYTSSNNTVTFTLTNAAGCDSVVTLDLTINNSNTGVDTQVHCDTYTWIDGNSYTSSNNTATHTLTNFAGCDSIVTLDLTINNSNTGVDTQVHCDTYTWIDGATYTASNNTATWTLTNAAGCDSVVTLDLTINNSNTGVDTQVHCDEYTWIDGVTYTESNNTVTFTITNSNNCDSIVTLDLLITQSSSSYDTVVVCDSYDWNGNTYTESGNYVYTSTNTIGCDSLANLDLSISQLETLVIDGEQVAFTETENNTYSISNPNASSTYFWNLSNNVGSIDGGNANNSEIIITWGENDSETILCVFEEDEFGCQGEESCITIDVKRPASIDDIEESLLNIYPNPFKNQTTVSFYNPTQSKAILKLIDSRGRTVRNYDGITSDSIIIKKEELSEGLYYIQLKLNNNVIRKPIVIQ